MVASLELICQSCFSDARLSLGKILLLVQLQKRLVYCHYLPHICRRNQSGYFGCFLVEVPWLTKAKVVCWWSNRSERSLPPYANRVGVVDFSLMLISRFGCKFFLLKVFTVFHLCACLVLRSVRSMSSLFMFQLYCLPSVGAWSPCLLGLSLRGSLFPPAQVPALYPFMFQSKCFKVKKKKTIFKVNLRVQMVIQGTKRNDQFSLIS